MGFAPYFVTSKTEDWAVEMEDSNNKKDIVAILVNIIAIMIVIFYGFLFV